MARRLFPAKDRFNEVHYQLVVVDDPVHTITLSRFPISGFHCRIGGSRCDYRCGGAYGVKKGTASNSEQESLEFRQYVSKLLREVSRGRLL